MDLLLNVYRITATLPDCERFNLVVQMGRAAVSIPSNIAEGWGRGRGAAQANFVRISRGSLFELCTQIEATRRLGYITQENAADLKEVTNGLGKKINAYLSWLDGSLVREEQSFYGCDTEGEEYANSQHSNN